MDQCGHDNSELTEKVFPQPLMASFPALSPYPCLPPLVTYTLRKRRKALGLWRVTGALSYSSALRLCLPSLLLRGTQVHSNIYGLPLSTSFQGKLWGEYPFLEEAAMYLIKEENGPSGTEVGGTLLPRKTGQEKRPSEKPKAQIT